MKHGGEVAWALPAWLACVCWLCAGGCGDALPPEKLDELAGALAHFAQHVNDANDEDPEGHVKVADWCTQQGLTDEQAVSVMIRVIPRKAMSGRGFVIRALTKTGSTRAVDPLVTMLRDEEENPWLRWQAAKELGRLKDRRVVPTLITMLSHEKFQLRTGAACALGWLGDMRAVAPLIKALADEHEGVRVDVCDALGEMNARPALEPLKQLLKTETEPRVIEAANKAIALIRGKTP